MKKIHCDTCGKNVELSSNYDQPKGWFELLHNYKNRHLCSLVCLTAYAEKMIVEAPKDEPKPEPKVEELSHV